MAIYEIKPGDTLTSIPKRHGISSWQKLYNDPTNANFRDKRPNPDRIFPGDKINIPDSTTAPAKSIETSEELPDYRMAIIDGTGPGEDEVYRESMKTSFCKQLGDALESQHRGFYLRGPSWHGLEVEYEAQAAASYLLGMKEKRPELRLMLAGYSRGGSAAIIAAEILEKKNIEIDGMFLFDAVARHKVSIGIYTS